MMTFRKLSADGAGKLIMAYLREHQMDAEPGAEVSVEGGQENPHRPFTPSELQRRDQLIGYLNRCSEDELIEDVLLPLFRQLGFHRITAAGHKDKALEYGKDVWMKYTLPTLHVLYFGIQAKKGKLDASGISTRNVAEELSR